MKRISVYLLIALATTSLLLFLASSAGLTNSNVILPNSLVVQYKDSTYFFNLRGADTGANIFCPNARNYHADAGAILTDMGINVVRLGCGCEGDSWQTNMVNYAGNDVWADHLESLLAKMDSMGLKCYFFSLGDPWGGELGIQDPSAANPPMSITTAESLIDKLAGNNKLNHDFITDPRIFVWSVSNEVTIGTATNSHNVVPNSSYYWIIQICDYIRSKGGKVLVASPGVDTRALDGWNDWNTAFSWNEPLLQGHVDYLEEHCYGISSLVHYYSLGNQQYNWAGWQTYQQQTLQEMIDNRGNFTIDQVILGEFGMWRGNGTDMGLTNWYFSDVNRRDYYNYAFQAIENVGLRNVCFHESIAELNLDGSLHSPTDFFPVVDPYGQPYPYAADIIKQNYALLSH